MTLTVCPRWPLGYPSEIFIESNLPLKEPCRRRKPADDTHCLPPLAAWVSLRNRRKRRRPNRRFEPQRRRTLRKDRTFSRGSASKSTETESFSVRRPGRRPLASNCDRHGHATHPYRSAMDLAAALAGCLTVSDAICGRFAICDAILGKNPIHGWHAGC